MVARSVSHGFGAAEGREHSYPGRGPIGREGTSYGGKGASNVATATVPDPKVGAVTSPTPTRRPQRRRYVAEPVAWLAIVSGTGTIGMMSQATT